MKLIDVFLFNERIAKTKNRWELLYEWWYSNSTLYKEEPTKITNKWLSEVNKKIPPPKASPTFPKSIFNPKKDHDCLLRYIATTIQNPSYKSIPIKFHHTVKNTNIDFVFVINENSEEISSTGGTYGAPGIVKEIKIEIPFRRFEEIYRKLENGVQCYSDAEDLIADINMTLAHELTHSIQNLSFSGISEDRIELETFKNNKFTSEIAFLMYFLAKNEIQSIQSEAYKLYTKRGSGIIPHNTGVKKGFIRCLATAVLRRSGEFRDLTERYNKGDLSFLEMINSLPECSAKLLLLWTIFVLGPNDDLCRYDNLLKSDPDYKLKENFKINIISRNIKNLIDVFSLFDGENRLQKLYIKMCFEQKSEEDSNKYLAYIFSTTNTNDIVLNAIKDWIENVSNLIL